MVANGEPLPFVEVFACVRATRSACTGELPVVESSLAERVRLSLSSS